MRGVGFGLERCDVRGFDIKHGVMGVVDFVGVGGALALGRIVSKFPKRISKELTAQRRQILRHQGRTGPCVHARGPFISKYPPCLHKIHDRWVIFVVRFSTSPFLKDD